MLHSQGGSDFANLLVGLLSTNHIVNTEDDGQEVTERFAANAHGAPEAGIEGGGDPCCTEVGVRVEVRERLRALEADQFAKVACDVEVEQSDEDGLPDCQLLRQHR